MSDKLKRCRLEKLDTIHVAPTNVGYMIKTIFSFSDSSFNFGFTTTHPALFIIMNYNSTDTDRRISLRLLCVSIRMSRDILYLLNFFCNFPFISAFSALINCSKISQYLVNVVMLVLDVYLLSSSRLYSCRRFST